MKSPFKSQIGEEQTQSFLANADEKAKEQFENKPAGQTLKSGNSTEHPQAQELDKKIRFSEAQRLLKRLIVSKSDKFMHGEIYPTDYVAYTLNLRVEELMEFISNYGYFEKVGKDRYKFKND